MNKEVYEEMCCQIYEGEDWDRMINCLERKDKEIKRLNNIINKAIEYIEQPDNIQSVAFCGEDGEIMNLYKIDGAKSLELLDILKGSNNEKDK